MLKLGLFIEIEQTKLLNYRNFQKPMKQLTDLVALLTFSKSA